MSEVLENALVGGIKKESLLKKLAALVESTPLAGMPRAA
jgi:hypothetical protein